MTRNDFILRAIISMAGKVIGTNGIVEPGEWRNLVDEAINLADQVEESKQKYGEPRFQ